MLSLPMLVIWLLFKSRHTVMEEFESEQAMIIKPQIVLDFSIINQFLSSQTT